MNVAFLPHVIIILFFSCLKMVCLKTHTHTHTQVVAALCYSATSKLPKGRALSAQRPGFVRSFVSFQEPGAMRQAMWRLGCPGYAQRGACGRTPLMRQRWEAMGGLVPQLGPPVRCPFSWVRFGPEETMTIKVSLVVLTMDQVRDFWCQGLSKRVSPFLG